MDPKDYWKEKHHKYSSQDWVIKPTIFAQFAIAHFPTEGKLLELGAGQGQDSRFFAKNNYDVISTDFSENALEIAKQKAKDENLSIEFKQVDLSEPIPFSSGSFDIVYSHLAVHYFDKQRTKELFDEMTNVLKPSGILALLLNTMEDPEVKDSKQIEDGLYDTPAGLVKRFFTLDYLKELTNSRFEVIVLDANGETYKDKIKTLIRFIGQRK